MPTVLQRPAGPAGRLSARSPTLDGSSAFALLLVLLLGGVATAAAVQRPLVALGIPAVAVGALACWRFPAAAVVTAFFLTGAPNTLTAFTPIPVTAATDVILACLWVGVLGGIALGNRKVPLWLWPGLIAPALYIVLTAIEILVADSFDNALQSFRLSTWYMAAFLLVALAPWSPRTLQTISRGVTGVVALIGSYCVLRYFTGPSGTEETLARLTAAGLPASTELRFYGSFVSANQLAGWCAVAIPFVFALSLGFRRGWRLLALAGVATCAVAVLASDVRTGSIAAVAGVGVVIGLYAFAQAFPATRIAHAVAAVAAMSALGYVAYSETVAKDPESAKRFENILTPSDDFAFAARQNMWNLAWESVRDNPWGSGLGTSGSVGRSEAEGGPAAGVLNIDSSYLKIALEQGLTVMIFFIAALFALLASLAWRAVAVLDRERATIAIGACGTLTAFLILFYAGIYIEGLVAVTGWILIGLGAAQFTRQGRDAAPEPNAP